MMSDLMHFLINLFTFGMLEMDNCSIKTYFLFLSTISLCHTLLETEAQHMLQG